MKHIGDHDENNEEMEEIMKKIWTLLLVIGIILSAAITHADPGVKESFYRNCIDLRIKNCDLKTKTGGLFKPPGYKPSLFELSANAQD